jgi:predicted LPLAT superfamily acyltransferase
MIARGPRRVRVTIEPPVHVTRTADRARDLEATVHALARAYERRVRAHPYQWFAFHDFWGRA